MESVPLVEHELKSTKERNEMRKREAWRWEVVRDDDVLVWQLLQTVNGKDWVVDEGESFTVSDAMFDARKALEAALPEMFS